MTDADLPAALAGIRENNERVIALCDMAPAVVRQLAEHDVPSLLAAFEAVLKLADDWNKKAAELDAMAERADARGADPLRTTLMSARAQAHHDCAQEFRGAIMATLAGNEAGDG